MSRQTSQLIYTATTPKPAKALAPPSLTAGRRLVMKLRAPSEGRVLRVYVAQESGTKIDFSVELLASSLPYGDGTVQAVYTDAPAVPVGMYRVIPALSSTADVAVDWRTQNSASGAMGHAYLNMDQTTRTDPQLFLYLVIIPVSSSDTTTWTVHVLFDQPTA